MRTRITCGWLVAHADGHHTLWRNAELVYEGNRVLFVGKRFEGQIDCEIDARNKLVAPGFIDTHVHSGHRASHRLISDIGRGDYFGSPFWRSASRARAHAWAAIPATSAPTTTPWRKSCASMPASRWRSSCATASPRSSSSEASCASSRRCSRRSASSVSAPISVRVDSGRWVGGEAGKLVRVLDEAAGDREFDLALEFIERHQGARDDRVRGILVPREIETCTVALMRKAAEAARQRDLPVAIHAAYNIHEVFDIIREHQMTSVELLREVGLMSDKLNIGHGNFTRQPPDELFRLARPGDHGLAPLLDLALPGQRGTARALPRQLGDVS